MEKTLEVNSLEEVVNVVNNMSQDQEFILNVDCFNKESECNCDEK